MQNFENAIQVYFGKLSAEELLIIRGYFKEEKLERNSYFTESDKICDRLSFVKSGILRVYALADGKEITQWIATENFLLTEVMGFFFNQHNRWSIQALTNTELLTISKNDYKKLCSDFPKWLEIEKKFLMNCFSMMEDRVFSHLSMTAEQRYSAYFQKNKELFNKVPLQFIASVLGMTPETFSRIRSRQNTDS